MGDAARLSSLKKGECAYVAHVDSGHPMGLRLLDLGLIPGTEVSCVQISPLGDPAAYLVRGAVFALRREDSSRVKVHRLEG